MLYGFETAAHKQRIHCHVMAAKDESSFYVALRTNTY